MHLFRIHPIKWEVGNGSRKEGRNRQNTSDELNMSREKKHLHLIHSSVFFEANVFSPTTLEANPEKPRFRCARREKKSLKPSVVKGRKHEVKASINNHKEANVKGNRSRSKKRHC
jgi:hypothetical protein